MKKILIIFICLCLLGCESNNSDSSGRETELQNLNSAKKQCCMNYGGEWKNNDCELYDENDKSKYTTCILDDLDFEDTN